MQFYQARLAGTIWLVLAALNVALSVARYHRHHSHDGFALVQGVTWLLVFCVHAVVLTTCWTFTESSLLQRRAFWLRTVPYASIPSVEPLSDRSREVAVIVYGGNMPITLTERLTVQPQDFAGFLAELERHAPQAVFHV